MSNVNITFQCTQAHLNDSLKRLCKSFNVPKTISKDGFECMKVNDNVNDNEWYYNCDKVFNNCKYYLENDVLSLAYILQKQIISYNEVIDKVIDSYELKSGEKLGLD